MPSVSGDVAWLAQLRVAPMPGTSPEDRPVPLHGHDSFDLAVPHVPLPGPGTITPLSHHLLSSRLGELARRSPDRAVRLHLTYVGEGRTEPVAEFADRWQEWDASHRSLPRWAGRGRG